MSARENRTITQEEFGRQLQKRAGERSSKGPLARATINTWMNGRRDFPASYLLAAAELAGLTPATISALFAGASPEDVAER